jgi:hypothetical protein
MTGISPLMGLLFAWGAVTTVFVILMIYRSLVRQMPAGQRALHIAPPDFRYLHRPFSHRREPRRFNLKSN